MYCYAMPVHFHGVNIHIMTNIKFIIYITKYGVGINTYSGILLCIFLSKEKQEHRYAKNQIIKQGWFRVFVTLVFMQFNYVYIISLYVWYICMCTYMHTCLWPEVVANSPSLSVSTLSCEPWCLNEAGTLTFWTSKSPSAPSLHLPPSTRATDGCCYGQLLSRC